VRRDDPQLGGDLELLEERHRFLEGRNVGTAPDYDRHPHGRRDVDHACSVGVRPSLVPFPRDVVPVQRWSRPRGGPGPEVVPVQMIQSRLLSPPRRLLVPLWILHRFLYRASGGRVGRRLAAVPTLLLTTVGRQTGRRRRTALYYLEDGQNLVVVASNAGSEREPGWWRNLQSLPDAEVWLGPARRSVRARRAGPDEVERLWPRLVELYAGYERYRSSAGREIPVVMLEPAPRYRARVSGRA
jgi:deazaflavin-dependent oxidoreductase (nitroreductase family)